MREVESASPMVQSKWLSVIGVGAEGLSSLTGVAKFLLDQAEVIVGGKRHLGMLSVTDGRIHLAWESPLEQTISQIATFQGKPVCVLASGDPMFYGIGATLLNHFSLAEMTIIPAVSSMGLACSRLGWAWTEVEAVSVCGRPLEFLNALVYPQAKLILLSATAETPTQVAQHLTTIGYGNSQVHILENLGHSSENHQRVIAKFGSNTPVKNLNLLGIECHLDPETSAKLLHPNCRLAGLPDSAYVHDGQLTKQEVRAMTLAALAPLPGQLLWDVGAGSGAIGIEWLRSHPRCQAIAIERHPQRLQNITTNATALGTPNLEIVAGVAPEILADLPQPDAIFLGGGVHIPQMLETCWQALKPGGRLVVNAVTVNSEQVIFNWQSQVGGSLRRIAIQRAESLGNYLAWRALAPVTQWQVCKPDSG